jgi:F-type H+-transporting ATPase subunit b
MDGATKAILAESFRSSPGQVVVRSTFELLDQQRATIHKALNEALLAEFEVRFEIAPDLIGGIEVVKNGRKVAWSIGDYLISLEKGVVDWLNEHAKPAPLHASSTTRPGVPKRS